MLKAGALVTISGLLIGAIKKILATRKKALEEKRKKELPELYKRSKLFKPRDNIVQDFSLI